MRIHIAPSHAEPPSGEGEWANAGLVEAGEVVKTGPVTVTVLLTEIDEGLFRLLFGDVLEFDPLGRAVVRAREHVDRVAG